MKKQTKFKKVIKSTITEILLKSFILSVSILYLVFVLLGKIESSILTIAAVGWVIFQFAFEFFGMIAVYFINKNIEKKIRKEYELKLSKRRI